MLNIQLIKKPENIVIQHFVCDTRSQAESIKTRWINNFSNEIYEIKEIINE